MSPATGAMPPTGVVVGRYQGTVMVTVHGELDPQKVAHLRLLLTDLIDGQGNVSVIVDLQDATAAAGDPDSVAMMAAEATYGHQRHAVVVVAEPSAAGRSRWLSSRGAALPSATGATTGTWFKDDAADVYEPGGFGSDNAS